MDESHWGLRGENGLIAGRHVSSPDGRPGPATNDSKSELRGHSATFQRPRFLGRYDGRAYAIISLSSPFPKELSC